MLSNLIKKREEGFDKEIDENDDTLGYGRTLQTCEYGCDVKIKEISKSYNRKTSIALIEKMIEELDGMKKGINWCIEIGHECSCPEAHNKALSDIQAPLQKDLEELKK